MPHKIIDDDSDDLGSMEQKTVARKSPKKSKKTKKASPKKTKRTSPKKAKKSTSPKPLRAFDCDIALGEVELCHKMGTISRTDILKIVGEGAKSPKAKAKRAPAKAKSPKSPTKKATRAKKDPNAPKGAMNSYMHFANANRDDVKRELNTKKIGEIGKELGKRWNAIKGTSKAKKFEALAQKDKERYERVIKAYRTENGLKSPVRKTKAKK